MVTLFVIAFLVFGDQILLIRRINAKFGDGLYSMVGGKVEQGETARQAIRREVFEEVGLDIAESEFELVHALNRRGTETEFVALCFKADISKMNSPINNEPDKCDDVGFFDLRKLPDNMISAHKQVIECVAQKITYSEHGWK